MTFNYVDFVNDGWESQQKYADAAGIQGPWDSLDDSTRHAKVIEHIGHMQEEIIEARVYVPRRSWKTSEPSFLDNEKLRKEFIAELFDVLLFHRSVLAYAGVTGEEFAEVAAEKLRYNSKRKDHIVNGTDAAPQDPAAELSGHCDSADFDSAAVCV